MTLHMVCSWICSFGGTLVVIAVVPYQKASRIIWKLRAATFTIKSWIFEILNKEVQCFNFVCTYYLGLRTGTYSRYWIRSDGIFSWVSIGLNFYKRKFTRILLYVCTVYGCCEHKTVHALSCYVSFVQVIWLGPITYWLDGIVSMY